MANYYSSRDSKGYRLRLYVNEKDIDTTNNRSKVEYKIYMEKNGNYSFQTSGNKIKCSINGTQVVNSTVSINMVSATSVLVASGTTSYISHNSDGTKTVSCSASYTPSSSEYYMPTSKTTSGNLSLTKIPRASTITVPDSQIGANTTITIRRGVSTYTDTLTYTFGSLSGTIATKTNAEEITWLIPSNFTTQIPNTVSGVCFITCETFDGDVSKGTTTYQFKCFILGNESKPTVDGTIVTTDSLSNTLTGDTSTIIRYVSNVNATITTTPQNNATISSKLIQCGDGQQLTDSGSLTNVGSGNFTFSVVDSRGLSNSTTVTKTLIEYIPVTINGDATRPNPASTTINVTLNGNYFNGSFGSQSNSLSFKYRTKQTSSSTWSSWATLSASPTISDNTYTLSSTSLGNSFSYRYAYDVEVAVLDKVNTTTTIVFKKTVPSGSPIYWWNENNFYHNTDVYLQNGDKLDQKLIDINSTLTALNDAIYFKDGDTVTFATSVDMSGCVTNSTKDVWLSYFTHKSLANIDSVTVTSFIAELRGISGYLNNDTGYIEYVGKSGYTVEARVSADNVLSFHIVKSSAWTNTTNNTPVTGRCTISFTVHEPSS